MACTKCVVFLLPVVYLILLIGPSDEFDPCISNVYLENLLEGKRNPNHTTPDGGENVCDYFWLDESLWYRFDSPATYRMSDLSEGCARFSKCGTTWPIWMNGFHPIGIFDVMNFTVCSTDENGDCCAWTSDISVKLCQGANASNNFYVYKLKRVPFCDMAYCAVGGYNPAMFQVPLLSSPPNFSGPHVFNESIGGKGFADFYFKCTINYNKSGDNATFDVSLTFDNNPDPGNPDTHITANSSSLTVTFPSIAVRGNMGKRVSCQVRSYWRGSDIKSSIQQSKKSYWVGIDYKTPFNNNVSKQIEVSHANTTFNVTFYSTVPLALPGNLLINYSLTILKSGAACVLPFYPNNPTVTVVVRTEPSLGCRSLTSVMRFLPPAPYKYKSIWDNYTVADIFIVIFCNNNTVRPCISHQEPIITTFDGARPFATWSSPGDYRLFRSRVGNRLFEVHTRHTPCSIDPDHRIFTTTCNTAVAVREGNDILGIISDNGTITKIRYLRDPNTPLNAAYIQNNSDYSYKIIMPSGAYVMVRTWQIPNVTTHYMDIDITPLLIDAYHSDGLCGNYNYNSTDDEQEFFDGVDKYDEYDPWRRFYRCTAGCKNHTLNATESYINGHIHAPRCIDITDNAVLCACTGNNFIECAETSTITVKIFSTFNTDNCIKGKRKKRDTEILDDNIITPEDFPIPPTVDVTNSPFPRFPTPSGINVSMAAARCRAALESFPAYNICVRYTDVEMLMSSCMMNVLLLDSLPCGVGTVVDELKQRCLFDIQSSVDTRSSNPAKQPEAVDEVAKAVVFYDCPGQPTTCSGHGNCSASKCVCDLGYTGSDCSLRADAVPTLTGFRRGCLCDARVMACQLTFILASDFDPSSNLKCKIMPSDASSVQAMVSNAEVLSRSELACQLPPTPVNPNTTRSVNVLNISVSNDGQRYGNVLQLVVYDSMCLNCDCNGVCTPTASACYIRGQCFAAGQTNPTDSSLLCLPGITNTHWSQSNLTFSTTLTPFYITQTSDSTPSACEQSDGKTGLIVLGVFLAISLIVNMLLALGYFCRQGAKTSERGEENYNSASNLPYDHLDLSIQQQPTVYQELKIPPVDSSNAQSRPYSNLEEDSEY